MLYISSYFFGPGGAITLDHEFPCRRFGPRPGTPLSQNMDVYKARWTWVRQWGKLTWMDLTKNRGTPTGNHRNMVISPSQ